MNALAIPKAPGALVQFEARDTQTTQAKADALIDFAKRMRDWPTLELAVDEKIEDQAEFVRWWRENVRNAGNQPNVAVRGQLSVADAEAETGITKQQVSRWDRRLADREAYRATLYGWAYAKAMAEKSDKDTGDKHVRGTLGTGENEWYTPAEYLDLARNVIGDFDLDPASSEIANQKVNAKAIYTEADNGLDLSWHGAVWLNPPYAQPAIGQFIEKAVSEFAAGDITGMIVLTHNYTDTRWFQTAAQAATAICFTRGRVKFESPTGELAAPTQGQAFFYFGDKVSLFHQHFASIGFVVEVLK